MAKKLRIKMKETLKSKLLKKMRAKLKEWQMKILKTCLIALKNKKKMKKNLIKALVEQLNLKQRQN
jgi:hypothetical protein